MPVISLEAALFPLKSFAHLVAVVHSRHYLSEEVSRLSLAQSPPLADVVVQLPFTCILHDDHNLIFIFEHCTEEKKRKEKIPQLVQYI